MMRYFLGNFSISAFQFFCFYYMLTVVRFIGWTTCNILTSMCPTATISQELATLLLPIWIVTSFIIFFNFVLHVLIFFANFTTVKPPKDGRFGPKFSNPRDHSMRGDSIPIGAPFGPTRLSCPSCRRGTLL